MFLTYSRGEKKHFELV